MIRVEWRDRKGEDKSILLSGLYEETGRVGDKPMLLSGLYEELGQVADKPILLSGLCEKTGRVGDKPCNIVIRVLWRARKGWR